MKHNCSICLEDTDVHCFEKSKHVMKKQTNSFVLQCKHCFHKKCIKEWYKHSNECTCCRKDIMFYNIGTYYNDLLHMSHIKLKSNEKMSYANNIIKIIVNIIQEIVDNYVYHDNAMKVLFIFDIKTNELHHCYNIVNSLKKRKVIS